jgi:hypothetical protein
LKAEPATTTTSKPGTTKGPISPQPKKIEKRRKNTQASTQHCPQTTTEDSLREQLLHNSSSHQNYCNNKTKCSITFKAPKRREGKKTQQIKQTVMILQQQTKQLKFALLDQSSSVIFKAAVVL